MRRRVGSRAQAVGGGTSGLGDEMLVWWRDGRRGALRQRQRGLKRREGVRGDMALVKRRDREVGV